MVYTAGTSPCAVDMGVLLITDVCNIVGSRVRALVCRRAYRGGVRRRAEVRVHTIISHDHLIFLALCGPSDGTKWTRTPGVHGMASKGSVKL